MNTLLQRALAFTEPFEGGYVNNPNDPGGATNMGITLTTLKEAAAKLHGHTYDPFLDGNITINVLKMLTIQEVEDIVTVEGFWCDAFDQINDILAIKTFDFGFNMGIRSGNMLLQNAVNDTAGKTLVYVDGVLGPNSVKAVTSLNATGVLANLIARAKSHYIDIVHVNPKLQEFLNGWIRRAEAVPAAS